MTILHIIQNHVTPCPGVLPTCSGSQCIDPLARLPQSCDLAARWPCSHVTGRYPDLQDDGENGPGKATPRSGREVTGCSRSHTRSTSETRSQIQWGHLTRQRSIDTRGLHQISEVY